MNQNPFFLKLELIICNKKKLELTKWTTRHGGIHINYHQPCLKKKATVLMLLNLRADSSFVLFRGSAVFSPAWLSHCSSRTLTHLSGCHIVPVVL